MDEPRREDRPLALDSPALRRVLAVLSDADRPQSAAEVAAVLELHVTTVRSHLEHLERAGLVAHEVSGEGRRGRPSHRYQAIRRDPDRAREELIGALAAALAVSPARRDDLALAAGRRWAEGVAVADAGVAPALTSAFAELGFDPVLDGDAIRLRGCPFRQAARAHPDVICRVHLGLAQRLAEQAGGAAAALDLRPFVEPELCVVELSATRRV